MLDTSICVRGFPCLDEDTRSDWIPEPNAAARPVEGAALNRSNSESKRSCKSNRAEVSWANAGKRLAVS